MKKQVVVNGWVVVPAGANGHATVTAVEHAASNGSGGKLSMSVDWVYSADGGMVQLSTTNHASENGDTKGAASTATLLSWVFLGPVGFFAHNFVRGRELPLEPIRPLLSLWITPFMFVRRSRSLKVRPSITDSFVLSANRRCYQLFIERNTVYCRGDAIVHGAHFTLRQAQGDRLRGWAGFTAGGSNRDLWRIPGQERFSP